MLGGRGFGLGSVGGCRATFEEGFEGCPALHAAALVGALMVVFPEEGVEVALHLREIGASP